MRSDSPSIDLPLELHGSHELTLNRRLSTQVATLHGLIAKVDENMANIQNDVADIKEDAKDLRESNKSIFKIVNSLKTHFVESCKKIVRKDPVRKTEEKMSNKRPRPSE